MAAKRNARVEARKHSKVFNSARDKYKELVEQTLYEFKTGKLTSYEGEAIRTEEDAMSVALARAEKLLGLK
jgi:hypothetical protein